MEMLIKIINLIKIQLIILHLGALLFLFSCVNNNSTKTISKVIVEKSKIIIDSLNENLIKEFTFEVPISKSCYLKDFTKDNIDYIDKILVITRESDDYLLLSPVKSLNGGYLACNEPYLRHISPKYFKLGDSVLISGFVQPSRLWDKVIGTPIYLTNLKTKRINSNLKRK